MNVVKKLKTKTPIDLLFSIKNRFKKRIFKLKYKNLKRFHSWSEIQKQYKIKNSSNDFFLSLKKEKHFYDILKNTKDLPEKVILDKADELIGNCFEIFGHKDHFYKINWHFDCKLKNFQPNIANKFYQDIYISNKSKQNLQDYAYDIKNPWELSRFQHLYYIGKAYQITNNEKYSQYFQKQIEDWIEKNKFLYGPNWVSPMEVAIRSINLILAFHFFKNSHVITKPFWGKFICMLFDHATYLEYNWEKYKQTNNHYLSDLIGYFYLCIFFQDVKSFHTNLEWCFKEIIKEIDTQINIDGTAYEGSTNYHQLVTEIVWLFITLSQSINLKIPKLLYDKFESMQNFIGICQTNHQELLQIGDNDSGKIIPQPPFLNKEKPDNKYKHLFHFPNFGLTIIKNNWEISYRHGTYDKKQPTGHFHQDDLAITLNIGNIPILVDCGSYVYTANKAWRNLMRSYENHNTFYITGANKQEDLDELFLLQKQQQKDTSIINNDSNLITIKNHSFQSDFKKLQKFRKLNFYKNENKIQIDDWIKPTEQINSPHAEICWNFIFHPQINLVNISEKLWEIKHFNNTVLILHSELNLEKSIGFYSPSYGKIQPCQKLSAKFLLQTNSITTKVEEKDLFSPQCVVQTTFELPQN
ncbi:TPA: hypothetical protein DEO28_00670 [Candidatus Dependentiae bacterium]|nr:MAG: hypothetical protein UR14_C0001G0015 [candidate division TM6 bacterium GW2011_GWE2_31_21]KKP54105.1 MAG: hypothetical protein UR43_C0001G0123 [candidate division TM6 bacterium GW2011_GWF2_33_332]HBS48313.1 hypothetical protein [Candidatus Dependentiae bacterium]HBZ73013.1 hypothetical protein [Candidatus Dependentiae bacterium]